MAKISKNKEKDLGNLVGGKKKKGSYKSKVGHC